MDSNTTGADNTAMGVDALQANTTASNNVAVGRLALGDNTTGHSNTCLGYGALRGNLTGNYNVAVGFDSGYYGQGRPMYGNNNTIIGAKTAFGVETQHDQILIGYAGIPSTSDNTARAHLHNGTGTWSKIQLGYLL